jgi:selenocysteine lyase/cysteine desulfurase
MSGPETIEREILKRSGYLVTELENLGLKVCTPAEDEHRAGLVTFLTRRHENMAQQFLKESIYVFHQPKAVVKSLRWPTGGFRVDPTFFNTFEELDSFLSCVKKNK